MSIKEIARLAGVSVSTVSKIVNGKADDISAETRERVLKIVKEYNYTPYDGVRAQNQGRSFMIGVILNARQRHEALLLSITKAAMAEGYATVVYTALNALDEYKGMAVLRSKRVDGVIWDMLEDGNARCEELLKKEGTPIVRIDTNTTPSGDNVGFDYGKLGYIATKTLINKGHRALCCLVDGEDQKSELFYKGFEKCLFDMQIPRSLSCRAVAPIGEADSERIPFGVTGVVCSGIRLAGVAYREAQHANRQIPKYMSVVSLDESENGESFYPALTSFALSYDALGEKASRVLISRIENRADGGGTDKPEFEFRPGESVDVPITRRNLKIVVMGTLNIDTLINVGKFPNIGETVLASHQTTIPGGKGVNQAIGASKLGADVYLIGKTGKDFEGSSLFRFLQRNGVNTDGVFSTYKSGTGHAYVYVREDGESGIVVHNGANHTLTREEILSRESLFEGASFCMLQTEMKPEVVACAASLAVKHSVKVLLKPSAMIKLDDELLKNVFILLPNEREIGLLCPEYDSIEEKAGYFIDKGVDTVIATLGHKGCYLRNAEESRYFPAADFTPVDTTGAADAFAATLAVYLSLGHNLVTAIRYATYAAGYSITRRGVPPSLIDRELLELGMTTE